MKMIKRILFLIVSFLIVLLAFKNVNAQDFYATPKGVQTIVDIITNTYNETQIAQFRLQDYADYPNIVEIAPASNAYNCYSYALYSRDYNTNNYWLSEPESFIYGDFSEDLCAYIDSSASYVLGDYSPGDILAYVDYVPDSERGLYIEHLAVIYSNNNNKIPSTAGNNEIMVISKWDNHGLYLHDFRDCPYYQGKDRNIILSS